MAEQAGRMVDVVVVGAGISGLSAARLLVERGLDVIVVEARDRVGGKAHTVRKPVVGKSDAFSSRGKSSTSTRSSYLESTVSPSHLESTSAPTPIGSAPLPPQPLAPESTSPAKLEELSSSGCDLGAAYVGPTQRRVARLARDLGLELYRVVDREAKTVLRYNERWVSYEGTVPPLRNPLELLDVNNILRTIDRMAFTVPVDCPWKSKNARLWDGMTLEQFYRSHCWTEVAYKLLHLVCHSLIGAEPQEVSLLSFLHYVHSGQGIQRLMNVTHGAQERKIAGGAMQLCLRMAEQLKNPAILNSPVTHIDQTGVGNDSAERSDSMSYVKVYTQNGDVILTRYVIVAMPPVLLGSIRFTPPLSAEKLSIMQRTPMGNLVKTMTFYKRCYWRELGLSGQALSNVGPICYCLDDSGPDGSVPCLMGFVSRDFIPRLLSLPKEERARLVAAHYAETFHCPALMEPVGYVDKSWAEDIYSMGCIMFYPPGVLTKYAASGQDQGSVLRQRHLRVMFAGTETAMDRWIGYMDGAIESGERAAREVLGQAGLLLAGESISVVEPMNEGFPDGEVDRMWIEDNLPSVGALMWAVGFIASCVTAWVLTVVLS